MKTRILQLIGLDALPEPSTLESLVVEWRIATLAEVTSTGVRSVRAWLDGSREPEKMALLLMAEHFGCSLDWLLRGIGPEPVNAMERLDPEAVARLASGGRS